MFTTKQLGNERDEMRLLESYMNEIATKADKIDEIVGYLEAMSIRELMLRVESIEEKAITVGGFEHEDNLTSYIA